MFFSLATLRGHAHLQAGQQLRTCTLKKQNKPFAWFVFMADLFQTRVAESMYIEKMDNDCNTFRHDNLFKSKLHKHNIYRKNHPIYIQCTHTCTDALLFFQERGQAHRIKTRTDKMSITAQVGGEHSLSPSIPRKQRPQLLLGSDVQLCTNCFCDGTAYGGSICPGSQELLHFGCNGHIPFALTAKPPASLTHGKPGRMSAGFAELATLSYHMGVSSATSRSGTRVTNPIKAGEGLNRIINANLQGSSSMNARTERPFKVPRRANSIIATAQASTWHISLPPIASAQRFRISSGTLPLNTQRIGTPCQSQWHPRNPPSLHTHHPYREEGVHSRMSDRCGAWPLQIAVRATSQEDCRSAIVPGPALDSASDSIRAVGLS